MQALDIHQVPALRPPPLPDPTFSLLSSIKCLILWWLVSVLKVNDNDSFEYSGSALGMYGDIVFMLALSLVGFMQLSRLCGWALAMCQGTVPRPPPSPDPNAVKPVSKRQRLTNHKEFLNLLRSSSEKHRLTQRMYGIESKERALRWEVNSAFMYLLSCPVVITCLMSMVQDSVFWVQLLSLGIATWIMSKWVRSVGTIGLAILDRFTITQSGRVTSTDSISEAILSDIDLCAGLFRSLLYGLAKDACHCAFWYSFSSIVMSLQWITGLDEESATNMLVYSGDAVVAPLQVHTSWYNLLLFGIASCDDDIWSDTSTSCATIASLWWMFMYLAPPIPKVVCFIRHDIPGAWKDCDNDHLLMEDVDTLMKSQCKEWSPESEDPCSIIHHLYPVEWPPIPLPSDAHHSLSCQLLVESPSWRVRRHFKRLLRKVSHDIPTMSSDSAHSSLDLPSLNDSETLRLRENILVSSWVRRLHPAVEGRRWLAAEYLDKVVLQRPTSSELKKVSVNLITGRSSIAPSAYLQTIETVFNTLTKNQSIPLIVDSGASCCVSPRREDFVTYSSSSVRIKDLSGCNKVAGEGMISWKVLDKFGREYEIQLKGYHMPRAAVRLLSPQCVTQAFQGSYGGQSHKHYILRFPDSTVLEAPYNQANLPELRLSSADSPACFWSRCFAFSTTTTDVWADNVLAERNKNLSPAQKELMRWHQRLSHAGLSTIHNLCRQKRSGRVNKTDELQAIRDSACLPCTFNVPSAVCDGLLCAACETAKASRRAPSLRPTLRPASKEMLLKQGDVQPGDCISCDHFLSPIKGRTVASSGHSSSAHGVTCGTMYVDHATGWIFVQNQRSVNAEETIRGKLLLEREAADVGVRIKKYHADNGVFSSDEFRKHCESLDQQLDFSGVGAKFQNGIAERGIQTVSNMARANMLHATMRWPGRKFLDLWPFAIQYAVWVHNRLPPNGAGWSPDELWSKQKAIHSHLPRAHVFGCPVYVLDAKLQDGKKIPKWDSRARQGIFVGFSRHHSTSVPLILNPKTQHISPQYHVVFDDDFSTVPAVSSELFRNQEFERLFGTARERYIDPLEAGADPTLSDEVVEPPSTLLDDEWLSEEDLADRNSRSGNAQPPVVEAEGVEPSSEGDGNDDDSDRAVMLPQEPEGAPSSMLHRQEQRPSYDSDEDRPQRVKKGTWKDGPIRLRSQNTALSLLTTTFALSAALNWGQLPPSMSNAGGSLASRRYGVSKVRHSLIEESYLLQNDWSELGRAACSGQNDLFAAYFEPDLSDDLECYTITNVQPHVLKAANAQNAADNPSFQQAINGPFAEKWWEAMEIEMATLESDLDAWELVTKEDGMNILPSTWAFKIKRFPDGLVKKYKARFCVRGDKQKEGIDYFETWSPVVQWTTVRSTIILAAKKGLVSAQADITAAFVHAELKPNEDIFVHQPAGFRRGENLVLKLKRSVYGLKQAPRYFFGYLTEHLVSDELGFVQSKRDPCLFVGKDVIIVVYVDDILFFAREDSQITTIIEQLKARGVAIRREGSAEGFLGVDIKRSTTTDGKPQITFLQTGLTKRIITALGLDCSLSTKHSTPAETSPLPKDTDGEPAVGNINYPAVVGMLLYLSGHSRPDIAFAVSQVARYTFKPTRKHEQALVRIGRYLKGTLGRGMIMEPTDTPRVDCYPDADFAGLYGHENSQDPHCARSRTGYVISAFGCPVVWRSSLQSAIALSTMEAEYVALSTACKDLIPVVGMVRDLSEAVGMDSSFNAKLHIKIHEDNVGALTLARLEPARMTPRSKHYAIKYHWFREYVSDPVNKVSLVKVDSKNQLGDIFTKGLAAPTFEHLRRLLMGW